MNRYLFAVAIFFSFSSFAAGPLKLAITLNESGPSTSTSNPTENHIRKGAQLALKASSDMAVSWINHGESVEQTLAGIDQINQLQPQIVVGMGNSFQALLSAERMDRSIVLITPVATSDEILRKKAHIILLSNANSIQARLLATEIAARWKLGQKVAVVKLAGCPYCVDMAESVREQLNFKKIDSVSIEIHSSQTGTPPKPLLEMRNFSHVVLPVLEADAARLIAAIYPNNEQAIYWGADGWGTLARYVKELPFAKRLRAMWLSHYYAGIETPENKVFVRKYREAYGSVPVDTSAFFFEAVQLSLRLKGRQSAQDVMAAFKRLGHYQGLTGKVMILNDHVGRAMPLMTMSDGHPQMVKLVGKQ